MHLHSYIAAQAGRRFRFGTHDCVTFAGRWAEHVTGRKIVPAYKTRREGLDVLGARPMLDVLRAEFVEVPRLRAQVGDLALLDSIDDDLPALGIVAGQGRVACFTRERTLGYAALSDARHVFRVTA
jgi:hypothetical protein